MLKNQIWSELLAFIPVEADIQSQLHQATIDGNLCLELSRRYFTKLDQRATLERNVSKKVSLLAENVTL